jgi:hypothetical protein
MREDDNIFSNIKNNMRLTLCAMLTIETGHKPSILLGSQSSPEACVSMYV